MGHGEAAALIRQAADRQARHQPPPSARPPIPVAVDTAADGHSHRTGTEASALASPSPAFRSLEAGASPTATFASFASASLPPATPLAVDSFTPESRARSVSIADGAEGKNGSDGRGRGLGGFLHHSIADERTATVDATVARLSPEPDADEDEEHNAFERQKARNALILKVFVTVMLGMFSARLFLFLEESELLATWLAAAISVLGFFSSLKVARWFEVQQARALELQVGAIAGDREPRSQSLAQAQEKKDS